jgi:putative tryptophan/tyrosine transport system substrate-binding protein
MRRREFIVGLGSAVAGPVVARAQQARPPVVGFLSAISSNALALSVAAFRNGLKELGYVEGQNVEIDFRLAISRQQLRSVAEDLVRHQVAVIVATSGIDPPLAAKAATSTIPIVFAYSGGDPVKYGLVNSINRPGGNVTGVIYLSVSLGGKRLNLLRDLVPQATTVAFLTTTFGDDEQTNDMLSAAHALGRQLIVLKIRSASDIDAAFSTLVERGAGALIVDTVPFFNRDKILALAAQHVIPTIYPFRDYALNGGLMSYGGDVRRSYHQAGVYVGRILKGAMPADLPVQLSTHFELVINLKTAKALGLTVPETLLATADEVIQ